jgi:peptidoglycan/LPS O-acetylase OafA/YrhL
MSANSNKTRNEAIDQGRFFAAAGVVWIHSMRSESMSTWGELGRFAVPFFISLAILMTWQSLQRTSETRFSDYFVQRLRRLYLPMLVWSLVYIAFKLVKSSLQPHMPNDFPGWSFLWGETAYHLWFIPFLTLVVIVLFAFRKLAQATDSTKRWLAGGLMSVAALMSIVPEIEMPQYLAGVQWMWRATPAAICAFVLFALLDSRPTAHTVSPRISRIAGMVGMAALFLAVMQPGSMILETIAGLMFLVVVLNEEVVWKNSSILTTLGRISMGIYFCHLLFVKCTEIVFDRLVQDPVAWKDVAVFAVSLIGATCLSYLLYRFQATRWLVA